MFFKELETERLILRNISSDDRDFIYRQFSNDEVHRYLFDAEPLVDINGADEIIELFKQPEPQMQHRWILVKKEDGVKIGTCGFHAWDKSSGCCEVGYDLFPDFWGMGYMSEALQSIILFAQNDMKVKRIDAHIYADNVNSLKLVKKLGFVFNDQMVDYIFRGSKLEHKILTLNL